MPIGLLDTIGYSPLGNIIIKKSYKIFNLSCRKIIFSMLYGNYYFYMGHFFLKCQYLTCQVRHCKNKDGLKTFNLWARVYLWYIIMDFYETVS